MLTGIKKFFKPLKTQYIYHYNELPFTEQLEKLIPDLTSDFLQVHNDLSNVHPKKEFDNTIPFHGQHQKSGWRSIGIKFYNKWEGSEEEIKRKYPTAYKIVKMFGKDCPLASYSVLKSNGHIKLHHGLEQDYDSNYLRIHIPLIVPQGNTDVLAFEVMGEKIGWNHIWGFINSGLHHAYNKTQQDRLVFLIDIDKKVLGQKPNNFNMFKSESLETLRLHINRIIKLLYFWLKS